MIRDLAIWTLSLLGTIGVFAYGVRLAGKDLEWVGRHLFLLCVAVYVVTSFVVYAETKPEPPTPPPTPPPHESVSHSFRVGDKGGGVIVPYGAPIREIGE